MGAIASVNLLKNRISVDQAKDLVNILKEHPTLKSICGLNGNETELNMRGKMNGAGDAIMLAAEIVGNVALSKLIFNGSTRIQGRKEGEIVALGWKEGGIVALEAGMVEANFRNKKLGVPGAIIISAWLSSGKDKGTWTKFIFSGEDRSKSVTMETTMTVADFSEKGLGISGAIMLSAFLPKCTYVPRYTSTGVTYA
jgi:hypothetical protein